MDFDDPEFMRVFFELHTDLPREAPGDDDATRRALAATTLPDAPRVIDIGCGPGAHTIVLAEQLPRACITAVDLHQPFLDTLEARARERGVADRITTAAQDMAALPYPPASFDLIWCEGAIYFLGVTAGLELWRPLLAPGAYVGFTEAVYRTPEPPAPVREFWEAQYPAIATAEINLERIRAAGFECVESFLLPPEAWLVPYYEPLEARIAVLREKYAGDEKALAAIADNQQEIDVFRTYPDAYTYAFFVVRP